MIGRCDSCGFNDIEVKEFADRALFIENREVFTRRPRYCELCSSTFASWVSREESLPAKKLFATIVYGFNMVLREIRKLRGER